MRTRNFFLAAAVAGLPLMATADVWRVNNNPALVNNCAHCFTNLQDAADDGSVEPGDTLHLEPSPVSYGDLDLTKRLVIIGPGFMLGQGTPDNDGLQANNGVAMIHQILFNPGSDTSKVTGVVIGDGSFGGGIYIGYTGNVNHITLDRNFHWAVGISFEETGINNFTITRCYFENAGIGSAFGNQAVSNVMIANNYFSGGIIVDVTFSYVTVANNLFNWNNTHVLHGAEIKNNIFFLGGVQTNNNNIHHNGATGTTNLPAGSNNVPNVVFTNVFDGTYTSDDQKWRLASNYQTYMNLIGDDGTVPGMYGGAWPYRPSGVPAIPAVYQLTAPATAIQGDPLNVTIGTRSND